MASQLVHLCFLGYIFAYKSLISAPVKQLFHNFISIHKHAPVKFSIGAAVVELKIVSILVNNVNVVVHLIGLRVFFLFVSRNFSFERTKNQTNFSVLLIV